LDMFAVDKKRGLWSY